MISSRPKKSATTLTITGHGLCDEVNNNVTRSKNMSAQDHTSSLGLRWHILDVVTHSREGLGAYLEMPTARTDKCERLGPTLLIFHTLPVSGLLQTRHPAF